MGLLKTLQQGSSNSNTAKKKSINGKVHVNAERGWKCLCIFLSISTITKGYLSKSTAI